MSSTDNSQKEPMGVSPEESKHRERLLQLKIKCGGCDQLIDRTEILDYLNGVNNPNHEPIVFGANQVFHNEACMHYAMFGDPFEMVVTNNPHVDFAEIARLYPPDLDMKAWIHEVDRRIRRLP